MIVDPGTPPHCDTAVLHAPGDCSYCDTQPTWQALRELWGIAYTNRTPREGQLPCPSDHRRGTGGAHVWPGNQPSRVPSPPQSIAKRFIAGWHRKQ